eukprot:CAMPEP_0185743582 /NCGR_PEP_ID=MMETSP1174-20130828/1377_1 /TAXON_ID=35687 /ORGANISM="Dictyocha speculum, Strain CCMP1381" /LENGTH=535 /DNA_ID=CAMNT_0028416391 /DNA_START=25 /DNA_END=1632 /DNA_ORIENTATION=+
MASSSVFLDQPFTVNSPNVTVSGDEILASYTYDNVTVEGNIVTPSRTSYTFKTNKVVPKTGMMLVGWGGNNGSTVTAGIIANQQKMTWRTKEGEKSANYFGSLTQASTVKLGNDPNGAAVHIPLKQLSPMVEPNDLVIGGWDISGMTIGDAMQRAKVLDVNLQDKLYPLMKDMKPLPSIYFPDFIAANQADRADNVLTGTKQQQLDKIRQDIREFKAANNLDKIVVLWTANTERFAAIEEGINDTAENMLAAIARGEEEVSPSTIFAVACILEHTTYINGSPQNTFVPGVVELAERESVMIAGDDFKSGQTKMKSVMVDFLVSAGIKPTSIVSWNHLGNNDGKNLTAPATFRSKEISKSNVVDDMVASNRILFEENEHPDHVVVIKYVPYVGDSKRAMDEYTSEIFMGGRNTIAMHNTCEDSLLAVPLILDLVILAELCERIQIKKEGASEFEKFHPVLSILSYMIKAPLVPKGTPIINALFAQKQCIVNILRASMGLPPENNMNLEHKLGSHIDEMQKRIEDSTIQPARKRMRN